MFTDISRLNDRHHFKRPSGGLHHRVA